MHNKFILIHSTVYTFSLNNMFFFPSIFIHLLLLWVLFIQQIHHVRNQKKNSKKKIEIILALYYYQGRINIYVRFVGFIHLLSFEDFHFHFVVFFFFLFFILISLSSALSCANYCF